MCYVTFLSLGSKEVHDVIKEKDKLRKLLLK
jgi:hypothetical protein